MLTNIYDVDILILSYVEDLDVFPKNRYVDNILNNKNFWKLRLYNIHEYTHINTIDYKLVVEFLDSTDKQLDRKYFLSSIDISEQLLNLKMYNNPLYLLTYLNIKLSNLKSIAKKSYDNFISEIILMNNKFSDLDDNINMKKIIYNLHRSEESLHNYFNSIVCKNDAISICVPISYDRIKILPYIISLHDKEGFTNGKLLYALAKALPKTLTTYSNSVKLVFDGLYYDNGIYYMLNYSNKLLYEDVFPLLNYSKVKTFEAYKFNGFELK